MNWFKVHTEARNDANERCGRPLVVMEVELFGEVLSFRPACECRFKELEEQERQAGTHE